MKSRRAGHGSASPRTLTAAELRARAAVAPADHARPGQASTLGDIPAVAAALRYAGEDVRAFEQTEAYWKQVWAADDPAGGAP